MYISESFLIYVAIIQNGNDTVIWWTGIILVFPQISITVIKHCNIEFELVPYSIYSLNWTKWTTDFIRWVWACWVLRLSYKLLLIRFAIALTDMQHKLITTRTNWCKLGGKIVLEAWAFDPLHLTLSKYLMCYGLPSTACEKVSKQKLHLWSCWLDTVWHEANYTQWKTKGGQTKPCKDVQCSKNAQGVGTKF